VAEEPKVWFNLFSFTRRFLLQSTLIYSTNNPVPAGFRWGEFWTSQAEPGAILEYTDAPSVE
jgi:hypothetical protein